MRSPGMLSLLWFWRRAVLRVVLTMGLLGLGMLAAQTVMEAPMAPWMRSFGLWPTLTGDWHGTLEKPNGRVSFVFFEIRGEVFRSSRFIRGDHILGTVQWCDPDAAVRAYNISGNADNWRGTRFHLSPFQPRTLEPLESGIGLSDLQGEWNGDEIRAVGTLVTYGPTATATATRSSRPEPPPMVRYTLRRGSRHDFLTACGTKG